MVSIIIRATLTQLATPDQMRGRVNAVDMIFIGTSNEFGQFESGITAQWFGTVAAVVLGGIGTLVVIALWAWLFPELRHAGRSSESACRNSMAVLRVSIPAFCSLKRTLISIIFDAGHRNLSEERETLTWRQE
jgi:hypothetical protein